MNQLDKDVAEVAPYAIDWSEELDGDESILSATVATKPSLRLEHPSDDADTVTFTDKVVTAWIAGGAPNVNYPIVCRVVTNLGRTLERTVWLLVLPDLAA